ncbi:MAG: adenylyltransferase/cytidyltransferase family protein, partial [Cyanobacteriota bacterium]
HYDYLLKAKKFGDILIVGINSDNSVKNIKGPSRPINNEIDRARLVAALDCVDYTFLFDESTPDTFISIIRPDIHVKGDDYDINTLPEANTVLNIGAELKFVSLTEGKSTTNIIEKIINSQK